MAEYIEREALGIGKCNPDVFENKGYAEGWNSAIEIIMNAPAADVVEVVRCKDCKEWCVRKAPQQQSKFGFCACNLMDTNEDFFCAYGERKEANA